MRVRRLEQPEHIRTRALYEEVFSEDDEAFVDFYYSWKTRDNTIYVAEDEDGIHAMVHLNPFSVFFRGEVRKLHYIVAVATQKEYRHQGLMRRLLQAAERELEGANEIFTFLMPASEQIYLPFGYRFFGWQRTGIWRAQSGGAGKYPVISESGERETTGEAYAVQRNDFGTENSSMEGSSGDSAKTGSIKSGGEVICRPAAPQEYEELAQFANQILKAQYDIFIYRDASYYERLCAEQKCQGGEVMVLIRSEGQPEQSEKSGYGERRKAGRLVGVFCTARENGEDAYASAVREIILAPDQKQAALEALQEYVNRCGGCKVSGCQADIRLEQEALKPLMMGKAPGGGIFCCGWEKERVFINEVV